MRRIQQVEWDPDRWQEMRQTKRGVADPKEGRGQRVDSKSKMFRN